MALIDTLTLLPESAVSTARSWILEHFQHLMKRVVDAADVETGAWWQVLDQPGREDNYIESSGSAMFVYSILKGVRLGYLNDSDCGFEKIALRAYVYLQDTFVVRTWNGTLGWNGTVGVCSLNSTASYEVRPVLLLSVGLLKANACVVVLCQSGESIQQCPRCSRVRAGIARV
jgi:rhamnogalacturonyl hydrolase YesR